MRLIFYIYLVVMLFCYGIAIFAFPEKEMPHANLVGILNVIFLPVSVWWLARARLYIFWAVYLVLLAAYYGLVHPALPFIQKLIVYGTALALLMITVYDVLIDQTKGILSRAVKRYGKH